MKLKGMSVVGRVAAAVAVVAIVASTGYKLSARDNDQGNDGDEGYSIALFGDQPYNALGKSQYPALLADINRAHVAFAVHDGDLKSGGDGACLDTLYYTALNYFNSLERPLIFVPGDNDWTDCWGRYGAGTMPFFDPEERLNFERSLFFSTDRSLGRETLKLTRQVGYPENQRWKVGPVVYLGLNVQGSNDNFAYRATEAGTQRPARSAQGNQRQRNSA